MKGNGVIVMRLNNGQRPFYEHATLGSARTEAIRLAGTIGGQFVVYVPVVVIESVAPIQERAVAIPDAHFDDLPF